MTQNAQTTPHQGGDTAGAQRSFRLRDDIAFRVVGGEAFLVTADRTMHRVAAPTGVAILEAIQSRPQTRAALVAALSAQFLAEPDQIERDTVAFLDSLVTRGVAEEFDAG